MANSTTAAALEKTYSFAQTPTYEDTSPFAKQMVADFTASGIKASDVAVGTIIGYNSADIFVAMLKKAAPDVKDLASTINKGFTYAPDGGNATNWPADHAGFTKACVAVTQAVSGKVKLIKPFTCYHGK